MTSLSFRSCAVGFAAALLLPTAAGAATGGTSAGQPSKARSAQRSQHLGDRVPLQRGMQGHDVKILQDFLNRIGISTGIDGAFGRGTYKSVRAFERQQSRTVDGVVDADDIAVLRGLVGSRQGATTSTRTTPGAKATIGSDGLAVAPADAPDVVKQIIAAGNRIATKPYKYGGGHGRWEDSGYDCSGSMSYAFHGAGLLDTALDSSGFMRWGDSGPGQWVTTYANGGHSWMMVAGLRFDTSGRSSDGTRWHTDKRSASGYTVRHPPGL